METNELPEELRANEKYEDVPLIRWVKSHIRRAWRDSKEGGEVSEWMARNEVIIECQIKEHDARLLQSCEEQLKAKDEIIDDKTRFEDQQRDWIAKVEAELDEKSLEVERLREENNKLRFTSLDPSETGSSSKLEPTK